MELGDPRTSQHPHRGTFFEELLSSRSGNLGTGLSASYLARQSHLKGGEAGTEERMAAVAVDVVGHGVGDEVGLRRGTVRLFQLYGHAQSTLRFGLNSISLKRNIRSMDWISRGLIPIVHGFFKAIFCT